MFASRPHLIARTLIAYATSVAMLFGVAGMMGFAHKTLACGIDWKMPINHFDGVNELGEFSLWREIGSVDMGADLKVPLIISFKPARGGNSWLGPGWLIPLLESNVMQVDELRFLLTQPDGITRRFWRESETSTVLKGQGNWAGAINNAANTITLWADCGWRLTFTRGKIASITTPKNRILTIVYINGRPVEIQEQGHRWLRVESDTNGNITGITFGKNRITVKMGNRPRVDVVQGVTQETNLIGGSVPTLQTLTLVAGASISGNSSGGILPGARQTNYSFAVDEKVQPTVQITEVSSMEREGSNIAIAGAPGVSSSTDGHIYTWHPTTGRLLKTDDWTYNIKPGRDRWENVATERINSKGQREFWFLDKANGMETALNLDGVETVRTWFTSGILKGKLRSTTKSIKGIVSELRQQFYDENGNVTRMKTMENGVERIKNFTYSNELPPRTEGAEIRILKKDGKMKRLYYSDGKLWLVEEFDKDDVLLSLIRYTDRILRTTFSPSGKLLGIDDLTNQQPHHSK